jgi:predicted transposase/invertase (TIGR01784 family)
LLKRLVAALLGIRYESIEQFVITNPEMPPEVLGDKFCRLDIHMTVDGQRVDLEVQVADEGDYPERSLFYWARDYSTALGAGGEYAELSRTVIVSIVDFKLFDCAEVHSEFQPLEVTRHTPLTDKMALHYFELPKLPKTVSEDDSLGLWLALFHANTEEDLKRLEAMEAPIMKQAIDAYHSITATSEFKELERLRTLARHNEASALGHARREAAREATEKADVKWQKEQAKWQAEQAKLQDVVADKDAEIARLRAQLSDK